MPVEVERCPSCGAPLKLDVRQACVFCHAVLKVTTPAGLPDRDVLARALDPNGPFAMQVTDVFAIRGRGTVATGCIGAGVVRVGDQLVVEGPRGSKRTRCKSIEVFRKVLTQAVAGETVGLLLEGVEREDIERGAWIRLA